MRNLNLIKFIYILIMDTKINNDNFMTLDNLKQLIKIFIKFIKDTHGINIESEEIDLKKIIYELMNKIVNTKYGKDLNVKELNKITLKTTRDNIYENYKELFTNKKKFGIIHRENEIYNNRKTHKDINFKESSNSNQLKKEITEINNNNLNELNNQRNNRTELLKEVDFEDKMNDTEITKEDMDIKMKELEDVRNQQNTNIINKMESGNDFIANNTLIKEKESYTEKSEPINFNRVPEKNERKDLLDNNNSLLNERLNENLEGFNLDDDYDDYNLDLTNDLINNDNNIINNNPKVNLENLQQQMPSQMPSQIPSQNLQQKIPQTFLKKIIICSKDRDIDKYELPNKYVIKLTEPIRYIKRIKLVNILINFKKEKAKKNSDETVENFNYAILNLNNYDVNKSNNSSINNSFAFIYPNKVYDEEIFFENELDLLEEINISILNNNGELLKIKDNHIIELQLELL